jgi:hypothetical protein
MVFFVFSGWKLANESVFGEPANQQEGILAGYSKDLN